MVHDEVENEGCVFEATQSYGDFYVELYQALEIKIVA